MSSITKSNTVKHSKHFSEEMFETRLNITKASAYFDLTQKQRDYIDSYADSFCKTVRLKDGRVMGVSEFKQWWYENFILPKRKANLQAVIDKRGVCHKSQIAALSYVNTMKHYDGYNFKTLTVTWHSKEPMMSIRLWGHDQKSKISELMIDCTHPCKNLATFNKVVGRLRRVSGWMSEHAIALSTSEYSGNIVTSLRSKLREPRNKPKVIPVETLTHKPEKPKSTTPVKRSWFVPSVNRTGWHSPDHHFKSSAIAISPYLKLLHTSLSGGSALLEMEYQTNVLILQNEMSNLETLLPHDINLLFTIAFIAREIRTAHADMLLKYSVYFTNTIAELNASIEVKNLLRLYFDSLLEDRPAPVGGSLIATFQYVLDQPIQRFARFDAMFKPDVFVVAYRDIARLAYALMDAREGRLPYTVEDDLSVQVKRMIDQIDPSFIAKQYQDEDDGWGHTFNHARINEILNAIQCVDLQTK